MRYVSRVAAVAALSLLLGVSVAAAQHPQTRQGFWIGFGLGYGTLGFSCDGGCASDRTGSFSGYLKMGGTISPKLLLGGESSGWTKSEFGTTMTAGNASLAAYFYPMPAGGLFVKGGLGLSSLQISGADAETGFGMTLGTGYDVRIGTNFSITPVLNFNWGKPATGLSQNVVQLAIGASFH